MYEFGSFLVPDIIELLPLLGYRRIHESVNLHYGRAPPFCYNMWSNDSQGIWLHRTFQISAF